MAQTIRGVVFDKDGTLIDFEKTWLPGLLSAAVLLAERHGIPEKAAFLTHSAGGDPESYSVRPGSLLAQGTGLEVAELWKSLAPELPEAEEIAEWLDSYWLEHARQNLTPVCDLGALFETLRSSAIRIGIVTNDIAEGAHDMLSILGLTDKVDFVAGYDSGYAAKPAPGMIEAFLAENGLDPSSVVMVGDNRADMEAGRAAGCRATVGVLTGATGEEELSQLAHFVIPDVSHIPALLESEF